MLKKCKNSPLRPLIIISLLVLAGCVVLSLPKTAKSTTTENSVTNPDDAAPADAASHVVKAAPNMVTTLPAPTQILSCSDIKPNETITVKGHLQLTPNCDLSGKSVRFLLDSSQTSLDCNGAKLSMSPEDTSNAPAISIVPKVDQAIDDIQVANCQIEGYGHALYIAQKTNPNTRYAQGFTDPEANRALAPNDIQIINVSSLNSKNSGIFVGDHVHHVTFDALRVVQAGTVGLYFEFGSQHNTVKNSVFMDNGHRALKSNREAIAIDSSGFNTIKHNQFSRNGAGAIHLYRNCFEHAQDASRSNHFKRTESAANNVIEANTFQDEPVGVWVASRQSRNLKGFDCGAYPLATTLFASYHIDSAKNNHILNNTFIDVETGIIVEDDGTHIIGNDFSRVGGRSVKVGSPIRQKYAANVDTLTPNIINTVIKDNVWTDNHTAISTD